MSESEPPPFQSSRERIRSRINSQRVSTPAVLGVLLFMIGAILFGIWGPRMHQRNTLNPGIPLQVLVDAVINDFAISLYGIQQSKETAPVGYQDALGVLDRTFGEIATLPNLEEQGWKLMRARPITSLDGAEGVSGVRLIYGVLDTRAPEQWLVMHLISDPQRWSHFDGLGRKVILSPGSRIDDVVTFDLGQQLGISLVCRSDYVLLVTSFNPNDAAMAVDALENEVLTPTPIDGIDPSEPSDRSSVVDSSKISLLKGQLCRSAPLRGILASA